MKTQRELEFNKAIKELTNLNIENVQKDIANGFYKMYEKGKSQALADVIKIIDEKGITMIDYQDNWGLRSDKEVRDIIRLFKEELKAKLQEQKDKEVTK
jgi:hypothetical protein